MRATAWIPALLPFALLLACGEEPSPALPLPACGNGVVEDGEACDDGPANADGTPDACRTRCLLPACGDGVTDAGEGCDDGAANDDLAPDACRTACVPAGCGDGVVDSGEACDDGPANDDRAPDACRTACVAARCGDGVRDLGEACDQGDDNADDRPGACRTDCRAPRCGDGTVDPGEVCDEGEGNSDTLPDACRRVCELPRCGDGVTDAGEACDDANLDDRDGCAACAFARPVCVTASGGEPAVVDPNGGLPWTGDELVFTGILSTGTVPGRLSCTPPAGGAARNVLLVLHVPRPGDLVVEVQSDAFRPAVELREACAERAPACGLAPGGGGSALAIAPVVPAEVKRWIVIESADGGVGEYRLVARLLPPLGAGAPCAADGRSGVCAEGLGCADPDGDGAGSCRPLVPAGGACDPAGEADLCVETACACPEPGCVSGVCVDACGDGRVQAWEECDDGDLAGADNCTAACERAGRSCDAPYRLELAPSDGGFEWRGDTSLGTDRFAASCGTSWAHPDLWSAFTAPEAGTWAFRLAPEPGRASVLSLVTERCDSGRELACAAGATSAATPLVVVALAAGETVWPVVDGNGTASNPRQGPFTLRAERQVCGDGTIGLAEPCDDGNVEPGDGCSASCTIEEPGPAADAGS